MYLSSPLDNCTCIVHIRYNSIWWSVTLANRNKTPAQEEVMQGFRHHRGPRMCQKIYSESATHQKLIFGKYLYTCGLLLLSNFKTCQSVGILMKQVIHALIVHLKPPSKFQSLWENAHCDIRVFLPSAM